MPSASTSAAPATAGIASFAGKQLTGT
jgi:hypothetical protein